MNTWGHVLHGIWPIVVVSLHKYILERVLLPVGKAVLKVVRPKVKDVVSDIVEHKVEARIESHDQKS